MIQMVDDEEMYTVDEVAQRLRVNADTARRWIREGQLPAYRLGDRAGYRVKRSDLEEFLRKRYQQ